MKIGNAECVLARRHASAIRDRALVDAFARREDATGEIGDRTDLQLAKIFNARRKLDVNGFQIGHCFMSSAHLLLLPSGEKGRSVYSAARAACWPHSTVSRRI